MNILDEVVLKFVSFYLKKIKVKILYKDFVEVVKNVKKGDFIYLDFFYDFFFNILFFIGYDINGFNRNE